MTDLTESFRPGRPPEMQPVPHWERLEEVCCGAGAGGEWSMGLRGLVLRSQGTWGHLFSGGRVPGLAPGGAWAVGAPRDQSCARREARGRMRLSRLSREERGLIASNARSGPIPLPLGDLEPVPTRGWSKGGRMGSFSEYSHAIFF